MRAQRPDYRSGAGERVSAMQHATGDAWERSLGPCARRVSDGQVEPFRRAAGAVLRPCAYEKPTNWTLIGDGTGHRRQMNWMRVPEALDSAASTHFSDLAAFVFRMDWARADKQGLTKGGWMPRMQRTGSSYMLKAPKR
ncbi:hypothetical protein XFF4834R_plc00280 (plasmid) [Xanthomonas citri pv. fuscans]|nr:hypothetical protein XFF4834R_plc00280 [Xanthomonas citri pv. fuscans]